MANYTKTALVKDVAEQLGVPKARRRDKEEVVAEMYQVLADLQG